MVGLLTKKLGTEHRHTHSTRYRLALQVKNTPYVTCHHLTCIAEEMCGFKIDIEEEGHGFTQNTSKVR